MVDHKGVFRTDYYDHGIYTFITKSRYNVLNYNMNIGLPVLFRVSELLNCINWCQKWEALFSIFKLSPSDVKIVDPFSE